jgi:DNA polymerase III subunit delta'
MNKHIKLDWQIIGHDQIKKFLQTSIDNQAIAHAYLFYGPAKVGKTLTAKTFAKSLLCANYRKYVLGEPIDSSTPCCVCSACEKFEKKIYPDLYVLEREVNEKTGKVKSAITVSQVRGLLDKIAKRSFMNSFKIVIIPEAERLNKEASNCLLKTLEEPAPKTVIILVSSSKDLILPTILSRVQMFKFLPITRNGIYEYLLEKGANRSEAKELASVAQGRPTVAMKYFTKKELFEEHKKDVHSVLRLFSDGVIDKFKFVEALTNKYNGNEDLLLFLNKLTAVVRDLILVNNYKNDLVTNLYLDTDLQIISGKYDQTKLRQFIVMIEKTKVMLNKNINSRLALENLLLNI